MNTNTNLKLIWKTAILPIIDFFSLLIGVWIVYLIRYNWFQDNFFKKTDLLQINQLIQSSVILAFIVVVIYAFLGVYKIYQKQNFWQICFKLGFGILLLIQTLITYFFFNEYNRNALPQGVPSRFVMATGGLFALYFVLLGRLIIWVVERVLYKFNIAKQNVVVIGDKENFLIPELTEDASLNKIYNYPVLNDSVLADIKNIIFKERLSGIYLFGSKNNLESELAIWAERYNISFIFTPEGFAQFQSFGLKPILLKKKVFLELVHSNLDGWQIVLKRIFDVVFAICFIALFSWLYLIIAIIIKLDSSGPIFYLSERVGPDGRVFKIWKFRRLKKEFCTTESNQESLKIEQELIAKNNFRPDGILYKIENDPRSTGFGKFLEKTSLDELPQFFNVILGNMSVVGPRPHQPREVAKYANHHYKVLNIKPGITGFAQINGRSDLSFEEEVSYDTYYIEHWNFALDLFIILRTPFIVFFGRHRG